MWRVLGCILALAVLTATLLLMSFHAMQVAPPATQPVPNGRIFNGWTQGAGSQEVPVDERNVPVAK